MSTVVPEAGEHVFWLYQTKWVRAIATVAYVFKTDAFWFQIGLDFVTGGFRKRVIELIFDLHIYITPSCFFNEM